MSTVISNDCSWDPDQHAAPQFDHGVSTVISNDCIRDVTKTEETFMPLTLGLTPEQRRERKNKIGASNTPGIMRVSPWSSPIEEWVKITKPDDIGELVDAANHMTDAMICGHLFEPRLMEWFVYDTKNVATEGWTMQHPDMPYVVATPDGVVLDLDVNAQIPLEIKFVSARQAERWRDEDGLYRAPDYVRLQSLHQQAVMRVNVGWIVACVVAFEGVKLHAERYVTTAEEQATVMSVLEEFYTRHIATQTPPVPDASASAERALNKMYKRSNGDLLLATDHDTTMAERRRVLAQRARELKEEMDEIDNLMRARIGESDGIDGVCRWSNRQGTISYSKAVKEASLEREFLEKFRGPSTRILRWENAS